MKSNNITQLHVYLIGGFVMLLVGLGLWYFTIRPINIENEQLAGQIQTLDSTTVSIDGKPFRWSQVAAAKAALEEAEARKDGKTAQLVALENSKHPPAARLDLQDGTDEQIISSGTLTRWLTLPGVVVKQLESFSKRHADRSRVKVYGDFTAPTLAPAAMTIPRDVIVWTVANLTVEGNFNNVMAWAKGWNTAPFLVAVDGLRVSLADRNGVVRGTCSLTVYMFPRGQAAANAGQGGGQTGVGGYGNPYGGMGGGMSGPPGMPPGGMMGGPPGGMPPGGRPPMPPGGMAPGSSPYGGGPPMGGPPMGGPPMGGPPMGNQPGGGMP